MGAGGRHGGDKRRHKKTSGHPGRLAVAKGRRIGEEMGMQ